VSKIGFNWLSKRSIIIFSWKSAMISRFPSSGVSPTASSGFWIAVLCFSDTTLILSNFQAPPPDSEPFRFVFSLFFSISFFPERKPANLLPPFASFLGYFLWISPLLFFSFSVIISFNLRRQFPYKCNKNK